MQKGEQSEMIRSLDKLVKFVGIALIPIGIILFVQSFFFNGDPFRSSITSMVAAVIGMIPEGYTFLQVWQWQSVRCAWQNRRYCFMT